MVGLYLLREVIMLKLKHLYENYDLAKECLARYKHSTNHLDDMLAHYRVSSNAVYPFFADDEHRVCFLRLAPTEEKSLAEVKATIRFISYLIDNGYNAMKPYPMKDGKLCDVLKTEWGSYVVSCYRLICGDALEDCDGDADLAYGYGRALGELHNLSEQYSHSDEIIGIDEMMKQVYDRLKRYGAPQCAFDCFDKVTATLNAMPRNKANYGLIHYDFEPDNVLYDDESDKYGVIDFDDSIRCFYALDVVRALDAMDDVTSNVQVGRDAFIDGYRSVRTFTSEQADSLPLMRSVVLLQEYATILHVLSDPPDDRPDWMDEIIAKLTDRQKIIIDTMAE